MRFMVTARCAVMQADIDNPGVIFMKKYIAVSTAFLMAAAVITGCSRAPARQSGEPNKLVAYTTIYPLYDFTVNVGGDKVEVINLVPPGAEPHEWEPSPRQMAEISKGGILIYTSFGKDYWVEKALNNINDANFSAVEASKGIELSHSSGAGNHDPGNPDSVDPHIWLDPVLAKKMVVNIKEGLMAADSSNRSYYEQNAEAYIEELELLDTEYQVLKNAPQKDFITSHAAFGYLAARYGLNEVPVRGMSPESEPTPAKMAEIIKMAREKNISYVFFESMVDPRVSQTIAAEVGAGTLVLNPLGSLTREEIKAGCSYLSIMRENLANLKLALGVHDGQ